MDCLSFFSFSKIVRDYYPLVVLIVGLFVPHSVLSKQWRPERIALSIPNAQNRDSHAWIWSCSHLIQLCNRSWNGGDSALQASLLRKRDHSCRVGRYPETLSTAC